MNNFSRIRYLRFISLALLGAQKLLAADYYFSAVGSDSSGNGTQGAPWATIAKLNSLDLNLGDRVLFRGGDTFPGKILFTAEDVGTAANPVVFTSYGTGRATINNTSEEAFYAYCAAGVELRKLNFTGGSANTKTGILFYVDLADGTKLEHIVIDQADVSGFGKSGIEFGAWPYPVNGTLAGFKDVTVTHVRAFGNVRSGLSSFGQSDVVGQNHENIYVGHSSFYDNVGADGNSGSGIVMAGVKGALVEYCSAYNNGASNTGTGAGPVGIWCWDADNVVMQYNLSYNNRTGPNNVDGGGFDIDGGSTNCVLQYNYSYGNQGPGYLLAQYAGAPPFNNNTVRYNISQNDGRKGTGTTLKGGIHFWSSGASGGIQNTKVYGNTIYVTPSPTGDPAAIRFQSGGSTITNTEIYNNLFVTTGGKRLVSSSGTVPQSTKFAGNGYYSSGSTFLIGWGGVAYSRLAAWRSGTNQEILAGVHTGFSGDPLLQNAGNGAALTDPAQLSSLSAYKLTASSPVINAGIDLTAVNISPGSADFFGNTIPRGGVFDIGAHEADSAVLSSINTNGDVTIGEDYISYADQNLSGATSLGGGGSSVNLTGNHWKRIPLPYLVTANTMLEFTINAADAGEVVGVGFEENNNMTDAKRIFQVGGSQNWSGGWPISPVYTAGSGSVTYVIPAGTYYSGQMNWLVFAADDDANASTNVTFSNVRIYEAGTLPPSPIVVEATDPAAAKSADTHQMVSDGSASGGSWALLSSDAIGDFVTYNVGTLTGGQTYAVSVRVKRYSNRARIAIYAQASTGGTKYSTGDALGHDLYSTSTGYVNLPTFTYTPGTTGTRYFRFEVIGKNTSSSGYTISVDKITLTPQ